LIEYDRSLWIIILYSIA